jgi:hypothetical protein
MGRTKIEEFRRREIEARLQALVVGDAFTRGCWERIAEAYHGLAEGSERNFKL